MKSNCGDTLQYEVHLFIHDTSAAYILKSLTTITMDSSGEAELIFNTEEAVDEFIRSSGIPYGTGCLPYHRVQWIVTDSCGSLSVCEQRIDLYDCSSLIADIPSFTFTAHIPSGCQLTLFAEDFFIGGSDDCSLQDQFEFSFQEHTYIPDTTLTCPEAIGVELSWKIWIADEGRDLNCDGQIQWNERRKTELPVQIVFTVAGNCECGMPVDSILTGQISTIVGNEGIKDVYVSLLRPGHAFPTYITAQDGIYSFQVFLSGHETTIMPEKNDRHKNGVSTLDLVKIQKHLLGKELFNAPFQFIAADANNSQYVSAIDLVELRKLILGIYSELPFNVSWRFVAKDYGFPDTLETWTYASTITFTDMLPANADFYGIKIGDVNGTAQPNFNEILPRESLPPFELKTDQQFYLAGDIINVPIRISSDQKLTGFQFTLQTKGLEIIGLLPGAISIGEDNYALFHDQMTVSWFDENIM